MLRDGESGLGVEDEDEAERTKRSDFHSRGRSEPNPAVRLTVESSRGPSTTQPVLEAGGHNVVRHDSSWAEQKKKMTPYPVWLS